MNSDTGPASTVFVHAVQWLQGTLLGSVATAVAVIAVASVGLLLFAGRIDIRRGVQVVIGCFILFGAASIATGLMQVVRGESASPEMMPAQPPLPLPVPPATQIPIKAVPYDPYAGAALPARS
jgi:type IV secretory pathway VirB2 component (pilin)